MVLLNLPQIEWNEFLQSIDDQISDGNVFSKPDVGDLFSLDTELIRVNSGEEITCQQLIKSSEGRKTMLVLLRHFA